jgi:excisionase family DNA binding protein
MRKKGSNPSSKRQTVPALPGDIMASETKYSLPRVMTVKELSEYLRVHPSTIYKLLRRGELPGFRIGTDWRFNAEVIDRWCLERNMKAPDGGTSSQN